jgi:tetratricopeptide (TPR) repeat protein
MNASLQGRVMRCALRGVTAALWATGLGMSTGAWAQDAGGAAQFPLATAGADADAKLPDNQLTSATLFKLMMSEIAAQRGATDASYATEFRLAKETRDPRIARRAVEFAVQTRQPAQAVEAARLWTELAPDSQLANDTFLTLLILSGRYDEAEPLLAAKIASAPSKSSALAQVYGLLAQGQRRPEAYALTRKLADSYPALPEAHLIVAQAAAAAGDRANAVSEARVAVKLQPDSEPATIMLAQFQQFEAPKEADAVLSSYIARNPKSTTVRIAYARFLNGEKRFDDAAAQLSRVRRDAANNPETIYTLGLLAYQANRPKDSEAYFKHFIELSVGAKAKAAAAAAAIPQSDDDDDASDTASDARPAEGPGRGPNRAYLYLAQIAEDQKDYPRALDWLSKVGEGPEYSMAHIRRALILARQGKIDVARAELHAMPTSTPAQRTEVTLAEAQMLRDADQNQAAFDLLAGAVEKTPDDAELLYDYGMTAEKVNRIDVLENAMRSVMKVRPDNAQAYNALGYTLADRNERLDEAKALIEKANALAPDDASILDSLGWVQYRLGNNSDAVANLQKAYKLRNDAEIAVHLGEVLWVSGKPTEAEKAWADAKAKEPQNETLKSTLTRFNVTIGKR